jgi:hypothetical protein
MLREEDVADGDVHLGDSQTNQVLDPSYDVSVCTQGNKTLRPTLLLPRTSLLGSWLNKGSSTSFYGMHRASSG